jgi:hypothetical protein
MRRVLMVLILAVFVFGGVFAGPPEDWYKSYAEGLDQKFLVNAGIGFGFYEHGRIGVPPVSASLDYKLPIALPITFGGIAAFRTSRDSKDGASYLWTDFGFGARGAYHFSFLKNLDTYAGLTLGWIAQSYRYEFNDKTTKTSDWDFLYGVNIGARYFFSPNIGVYLELGYSGLQVIAAGVTFKF